MTKIFKFGIVCTFILIGFAKMGHCIQNNTNEIEKKVNQLIEQMTLKEKIGQMSQRNGADGNQEAVRRGKIGSILNEVNTAKINEIQRIAVEESRLGIPLLIGRDVIHGFRTLFPINLGLAATWNPELIEQGARIAAIEARSAGVNWTFAPMVDITRDPRWGRIAESFGEDPYLTSVMAVAMVNGFQGDDLSKPGAIAACAKHFAGYGAAEGGRDYNSTYIPEQLLKEVYLKPFKDCIDSDVATLMPAFHDLNGVPCTGNTYLLRQILRDEWDFEGMVVSDWAAIHEMIIHGFCINDKVAAKKAVIAGVDMEMATDTYQNCIEILVAEDHLSVQLIDEAVCRILTLKYKLDLFDNPYTDPSKYPPMANSENLALAKKTALQSIVMLQNKSQVLPLKNGIKRIAVFGPLADDPFEQLGTWTFDKNIEDTQTPLQALRKYVENSIQVDYLKVLETSRSKDMQHFENAKSLAQKSDVILLFLGEEAIITGEAHCRANINLPGAQEQLINTLRQLGKPIIVTIMAGRPLTIGKVLNKVDAALYSFHPGTMGGPAIVDILFGKESPSGKLPVTFPKVVGQIPIYYSHKNTGRPYDEKTFVSIDDIPVRAVQTSLGNESHYIDAGFKPQYPFGFGLSYTEFEYTDLHLTSKIVKMGQDLKVSAKITNTGQVEGEEIVQLYVRDLVGSITRPIKELKGFHRLRLKPGQFQTIEFVLNTDEFGFYNQSMEHVIEPGKFHVWVARDSENGLFAEFEVIE
jgi:beta-glucosidase